MDHDFEILDEIDDKKDQSLLEPKMEPSDGEQDHEGEEESTEALVAQTKELLQTKWDTFIDTVEDEMTQMIEYLNEQKAKVIKENKLSHARLSGILHVAENDLTTEDITNLQQEINSASYTVKRFSKRQLEAFFSAPNKSKNAGISSPAMPRRNAKNVPEYRGTDSRDTAGSERHTPDRQSDRKRRLEEPVDEQPQKAKKMIHEMISSNAENIVAGPGVIDELGEPFGKELTGINIIDLAGGSRKLKATQIKSWGAFNMPMGVDMMKVGHNRPTVEIMRDEVIVCNMRDNKVSFCDLDGNVELTISENLSQPSKALVLLDGRILVGHDNGVNLYDAEGAFERALDLPKAKVFGLLPVRVEGGMLGIYVSSRYNGDKVVFFDRSLEKIVREVKINICDGDTVIRFTECLGNTLYLADMKRDANVVWITDLEGRVRAIGGAGGRGMKTGQFTQAAGLTADNSGNFLCLCSKTSRIMAFSRDGTFLCEVQFPDGILERPTDLSLNDDGLLAVTTMSGKVVILKLDEGDPSQDWPTRSYVSDWSGGRGRGNFRGRGDRGRGRGRGDRGRDRGTSRGTSRGRGRGNFSLKY